MKQIVSDEDRVLEGLDKTARELIGHLTQSGAAPNDFFQRFLDILVNDNYPPEVVAQIVRLTY